MKTKIPGTRVFAILSANSNEVYLIGRGKYLGEIPFKTAEDNVRLMGISPSEIEKEVPGFTNPCLMMDDGNIVWGCECWWGLEDCYNETIGSRKIIQIDIKEERKKCLL